MKKVYYAADKRGHNDIGWLKANFSFSFASYYDPEKIHFGALRVLNDDIIAGGKGLALIHTIIWRLLPSQFQVLWSIKTVWATSEL